MPSDAKVSFLVLGGRAAVVVDVPGDGYTGPLTETADPVVFSFTHRGLRLLPAFLGQQVPETDSLLCACGHGQLTLTTPEEVDVLGVSLDELPDDWFEAADSHQGVLLLVGRDVGVHGGEDEQAAGGKLDEAAVAGRLLGAVVSLD